MERKASLHNIPEEIRMEIQAKIPKYFLNISEGILIEILLKIPAYFLWVNFRCVSKAWQELISSSYFSYKHNALHKKSAGILFQVPTEHPFYFKYNTYFLEMAKDGFDLKSHWFGKTPMGYISSSYNGLILETVFDPYGVSSVLHVKNNLTGFDITIPNCPSGCKHIPSACLLKLGFNPHTKEYKLAHFVFMRWDEIDYGFELFTIGVDKAWRKIVGSPTVGNRWTKLVFVGGRLLHWLNNKDYINSMDIWEEKFSKTNLPWIKSIRFCDLLEMNGYLAVVHSPSKTKIEVWVLKDFSTGAWSDEHTIRTKWTNYITLEGHHVDCVLQMFWDFGAFATLNNGEKILFRRTSFERKHMVFLYDIKHREIRKFRNITKSTKLFIPHHISLVRL